MVLRGIFSFLPKGCLIMGSQYAAGTPAGQNNDDLKHNVTSVWSSFNNLKQDIPLLCWNGFSSSHRPFDSLPLQFEVPTAIY